MLTETAAALLEELDLALTGAGIFRAHYKHDVIREIVTEQLCLLSHVLSPALLERPCVFVQMAESATERAPEAVWIASGSRVLRVDMFTNDLRSTIAFRAEVLRVTEVTNLAISANRWYGPTPTSDSTVALDFTARGRDFHLQASMKNCEQLQKLMTVLLAPIRSADPDGSQVRDD